MHDTNVSKEDVLKYDSSLLSLFECNCDVICSWQLIMNHQYHLF